MTGRPAAQAETAVRAADRREAEIALITGFLEVFDGNVTELLGSLAGAPLDISRISQETAAPADRGVLAETRSPVLRRDVLLSCGSVPMVRARSWIDLAQLPPPVRDALSRGGQPIGRVMRQHRVEVARETLLCRVLPGALSGGRRGADAPLIERKTSVWHGGRPAMEINEIFTESVLGLLRPALPPRTP
ncbi:chorismate--pyruvate lyase family protein [Streptomyces enissocaesilis]|uniref:Chorismate lyase n=1 Tax=Streptomyces enissocaesilis TaxID=332589 RepID=A0ABN3X8X2_9ACTN